MDERVPDRAREIAVDIMSNFDSVNSFVLAILVLARVISNTKYSPGGTEKVTSDLVPSQLRKAIEGLKSEYGE